MDEVIDIRAHNRTAIEAHPMANRSNLIEGSSVDPEIIGRVHVTADGYERILVCLDSNHTTTTTTSSQSWKPTPRWSPPGSDCAVFDTIIDDRPADMFPNRPWGPGDNPKTSVQDYLKTQPELAIEKQIDHKLLISVAPDGYLRRVG
ncbi:MAG: hypothetical protein EA400_02255 [Chromatiaceae bacterium]|nr:MAG: hypothetical protein EA400_02255 [Chromatiaceae bacterium]